MNEQLTLDDEVADELGFHDWMPSLPVDPVEALEVIREISDEDRSSSRDRKFRRAA